jgi:hypothetical protein
VNPCPHGFAGVCTACAMYYAHKFSPYPPELVERMAKMLLNLHAARRKPTRDYDEFDMLRDEIRKIVGDT